MRTYYTQSIVSNETTAWATDSLLTISEIIDLWADERRRFETAVISQISAVFFEDTDHNKFVQVYPIVKEMSEDEIVVFKLSNFIRPVF